MERRKPRIHYYIHGRGQGHATRSLPIILALAEGGYHVEVFAGSDAYPIVSSSYPATPVRSLLPTHRARLLPLLAARTTEASRRLKASGTDLVISDGDLPAILAASYDRRPSIAVGHCEIFSCCVKPAGVPEGPWRREAARAWISAPTATHHVAVNFIALPTRRQNTIVAAPVAPPVSRSRFDGGERVLCYFRDQNGAALLRALVDQGYSPLLFAPKDAGLVGVEHHPLDRESFLAELSKARAVVASAGSQLISECVSLGIPLFAVHAEDDDEQHLNVAMLRVAHLGGGCSFRKFEPRHLRFFFDAAEEKTGLKATSQRLPSIDVVTAVCRLARALMKEASS